MNSAVLAAVAAATLLVLAGCGTIGGRGDVAIDSGSGSGSAAAQSGTTALTIVVRGSVKGERIYSLRCDPAGGDHPDPEAACRSLSELEDAFAPVPRGVMCTEIYGGPQTATVTGTLRGEPVNARFSRTDGCEIARWDKHAALLVEAGGVERS